MFLNPPVLMLRRKTVKLSTQSAVSEHAVSHLFNFQERQIRFPRDWGAWAVIHREILSLLLVMREFAAANSALLKLRDRPVSAKKVEPKYPSEAKRAGKEGKVVLGATIDVDGKAKDVVI